MCSRAIGRPSRRRCRRVDGERPTGGAVDGDVDEAGGVDDPRRAVAPDVHAPGDAERGDQAMTLDGAEQRRQPIADERRLLEALGTGEIAHAIAQADLDRGGIAGHRLPRGLDRGRVRRRHRTRRRTGTGRRPSGPRCTVPRRAEQRTTPAGGWRSAGAAAPTATLRRRAWPSFATGAGRGGRRCALGP